MLSNIQVVIVGLGYVGLPLAVEFGKKYSTYGVDTSLQRVEELKKGYDKNKEVSCEYLKKAALLTFFTEIPTLPSDVITYYIVTVPTPINEYKKPDLTPLLSASKQIGKKMKKGDVVIYESTVYPGCTEEECIPVLEKESGLKYNEDFYCGYSPERINPGDTTHSLTKVVKITSGSTPEIAEQVNQLYQSIIEAGTYQAPSIQVAEAAKLIENCQRDVNISFVNELALIFDKLNIDTTEVLKAAATKWNFLPFQPGLVGGHCISIDPYYMIYKAEQVGYYPEVIGSGRKVNDAIGIFIANKVIKLMVQKNIPLKGANVLILGFTFKENCSSTKNTRVIDIYNELVAFGIHVEIYDPWVIREEVEKEYAVKFIDSPHGQYDALVVAVNHDEFKEIALQKILKKAHVLFDTKALFPRKEVDARL